MIDAGDFVKQGKPTVQQVRQVWHEHPDPSARNVCDLLNRRGFDISWRTVARYHASDWKAKGTKTVETDVEKDKAELDRALKRVEATIEKPRQAPPPPPENPPTGSAEPSPGLEPNPPMGSDEPKVDPEQQAFDARDDELMKLTENALRKIEAKRRIVTNIHIMEAMSKKAKVLVLIPKETGVLVTAMTEAAAAPVSSGKADSTMPMPGDDAHDVTPGNGKVLDLTPNQPSLIADSIGAFRRKLGRS